MKVLLVCEFGTLNGGEHSLLAILPNLIEAGIEFSALTPTTGELCRRLTQLTIPCFDFRPNSQRRITPRTQKIDRLTNVLHDNPFDLVHANSVSMSRIVGPIANNTGVPSVGHLRDIIKLSRQAVSDLNENDQLIAVSNATRDYFVNLGVEANHLDVIHNGIDTERFRPRRKTFHLHREIDIPTDSPLILSVGQLGIRKGVDVAIRAFEVLLQNLHHDPQFIPPPHLLLVGERHSGKDEAIAYERALHTAANREIVRGHVHFLGRRSDMSAIYNEADLLVHCARQEPFGRVLLEAAASGCCVLASDVGGTREIFPDESNSGCLVSPDDVSTVAKKNARASPKSRKTKESRS